MEATMWKLFCVPSEKGSILIEKNLLRMGANSFLLEKTPFQKRIGVQESKQEVTKVVSLVRNGGKVYSVGIPVPLIGDACIKQFTE